MLAIARSHGADREKSSEIMRGASCRLPWAWDSLCLGIAMHEASNDGLRDVVNGVPPATILGGTWSKDSRGNPAYRMVSGEGAKYPDHPRHDLPSTAITLYARVMRVGTPDLGAAIIANAYTTSDVAPWVSWTLGATSTDALLVVGALYIPDEHPFPREIQGLTNLSDTEYTGIFLRWRTGDYMRLSMYGEHGNILSTTDSGATQTGTIGYAAGREVKLNLNESDALQFGGQYSQCMVWSRYLTDVEVLSLVADPYGWYSPHRETVTIAAPFPVGPGMASMGMVYGGP